MKRTRVAVAGTLAMVAVAVVGLALLSANSSDEAGSSPRRRPADVPVVIGLEPEDVSQFVIEEGSARARLVRQNGVWQPGPGTSAEAAALADERETDLFPLRAYRGLPSDTSRAEFGLGAPELVVRVTARRGGELTVAVGALNFTNEGFYAQRQGDKRLYLLTRRAVDGLRSILRGQVVEEPMPAREAESLARAEQLTDPEFVTNPWLGQIEEEVGK
jgi:hypothetical protein